MSGLHEISGRCHCGNISYKFISPIPKMELPIKSCDCSFCTRQGACYTSHPQGRLEVEVAHKADARRYRYGSEAAEAFLCSVCGIFPFILAKLDRQQFAVLNANCVNGLHIDPVSVVLTPHLEGQSPAEQAARWQRSWIPHVRIRYRNAPVEPTLLV